MSGMESDGGSFHRGGGSRLSMRQKSMERKRVNKEHNSNFRAGYVPIDEDRLHKTGIRGRKLTLGIILIVILFILVVINFILTVLLLHVLVIDHNGMETLDFMDDGTLRFKYGGDMGNVRPLDSKMGGFGNQDFELTGDNQPVVAQNRITDQIRGGSVQVEPGKTTIKGDHGLDIVDPKTNQTIFTTDYDSKEFKMPDGVDNLNVRKAQTFRVASPLNSDLRVSTARNAIFRGNEGVNILGRANESVVRGNAFVQAGGGLYINNTRLPRSSPDPLSVIDRGTTTYKICVCTPSGKLFRVPITRPGQGCHTVNENINPCL
uniref:Beta-sarcoglycan n=1 Tax=Branchiostoma floridae TaxID=7739 RepID=C3YZU8_BRAFL|eukprot:XP_002598357.1 hypothetical protein BRAFLDRAFT_276577 [Branchiostoma floridae]